MMISRRTVLLTLLGAGAAGVVGALVRGGSAARSGAGDAETADAGPLATLTLRVDGMT